MAYSYSYFKKKIKKYLSNTLPANTSVLDVGAGCGTYYNLLHDVFPNMDAVEVFKDNIINYSLEDKYNKVYNMDIKNFKFEHYDLVIMGDVLEHLTVEEAQFVIEYIYPRCNQLLIAVPYQMEQGEVENNKYEIHLQPDLTPEIFGQRYPQMKFLCGNGGYGYYVKGETDVPEYMSDPKLSIIIPCHNTGKYIINLLDSLSSQEWNFRSKRELIFVLDNCSDNTEEIIKQYNLNNKGYEVQIIPANVSSAGLSRNIGLDNMTGQYVWFVDSDDWLACSNAIDVAFDCIVSDDTDAVQFKIKSNVNPKGIFGTGTVWMQIFTKDIIGETRFNDRQNGEDNDFVGEVYSKPNVSWGRIDFAPYFYNFPREDSLSDKTYGFYKNLKYVIALGATKNMYQYLYPLIASICKYNFVKKFYIFIEDDSLNLPFGNIQYININTIPWDKNGENYNTGYTLMSMARCYLPNIVQEEKALWIDLDTVCRGSLEELWDTDISKYYCAGVKDAGAKGFHTPELDLNYDEYINSGVVLFNIEKIRKDGKQDELISEINNTHFYFPDQDAINKVFENNILFLDNKWNSSLFTGESSNPIIYHWAGEKKNWVLEMKHADWWKEAEELTDQNFKIESR